MSEAISFSVGSIRCIAVHDGDTQYRAQDYVANADPGEVAKALERHRHPPDAIPSPYSGLVVQTGGHVVLIDTGAGNLTPSVGHLTRNLSAAGISADQVDTVVITHAHPDHIGANADDAGQPA